MMQLMLQRGKADVLPHVSPVCAFMFVYLCDLDASLYPSINNGSQEGPLRTLDSTGLDPVRQVLIQVM